MLNRVCILFFFLLINISANAESKGKKNIRYQAGKRLDFQSLLIEGEKKKANFSVVTGNMGEVDLGLLKLREHFHDYMQDDIREQVQ